MAQGPDELYSRFLDLPDPSVNLYRFIRLPRLRDLLRRQKLVLVRPILWEDPYENFLLQKPVRLEDGRIAHVHDLRDRIYAQSWCLTAESEAMWKSYAP